MTSFGVRSNPMPVSTCRVSVAFAAELVMVQRYIHKLTRAVQPLRPTNSIV
jgi:hypothetical protein